MSDDVKKGSFIIARADVRQCYLRSFNPDWTPPGVDPALSDRTGLADWTGNRAEAITFTSYAEAMEFWRQPSTVKPRRPDGKPNRPLTAYTVEVVPL